jgi:hypothetical protein
MDFTGYDSRLLQRLNELLAAGAERFPVRFRAAAIHRMVTDSPVRIIVEPERQIKGLFDCSEAFGGIQENLNAEFNRDPAYQPIDLLVPLEFLGRSPVLERLEREADIRENRQVRLRKEDNG